MNKRSRRSRSVALMGLVFLVSATIVPLGPASAGPAGTWSGEAQGIGLELAFPIGGAEAPPGIVAALSGARGSRTDSFFSQGRGAGDCDPGPVGSSVFDFTCNEDNLVDASSTSGLVDPAALCAFSFADLGITFDGSATCGDAHANVTNPDVDGFGKGTFGDLSLSLDICAVLFPIEDECGVIKDVVGEIVGLLKPILDEVTPNVPSETDDKLIAGLLDIVEGDIEVLHAEFGSTTSTVKSGNPSITARADAAATRIGLIPLPVCTLPNNDAQTQDQHCDFPAIGSDPLDVGLLIIEIGPTYSKATWDGATATCEGLGSAITVKIRDLTKPEEVAYIEVPLGVGESLDGLPGGTSISVGGVSIGGPTNQDPGEDGSDAGSCGVEVGALVIHLLGEVGASPEPEVTEHPPDGGILFQLASTNAQVQGQVPGTQVLGALPVTGGTAWIFYGLAAILAVGGPVLFLRSRKLRKTE